jgi:hypothetical protein
MSYASMSELSAKELELMATAGTEARPTDFSWFTGEPGDHKLLGGELLRLGRHTLRPYGPRGYY